MHQIFPSKGIWCAASADTCQGIKPKSRLGGGGISKRFSLPRKAHLTSSLAYLIALQEHNYNVWHMLNNKLPIPESIVFCAFCNIWLIVPPTSVGCWLIVLSHSLSEFSSKKTHHIIQRSTNDSRQVFSHNRAFNFFFGNTGYGDGNFLYAFFEKVFLIRWCMFLIYSV